MTAAAANGKTARSGHDGKAVLGTELLPRVKTWAINVATSESAWGDSDSMGYTNRKAARHDCTGTLTGVLDKTTAQAIHRLIANNSGDSANPFVGAVTELTLWEKHSDGDSWYFPCVMIQSFDVTFDMDTYEVVEWSIAFGSDGQFYRPGVGSGREDGV